MNKEFIPYEQALELKELDFDEPCIMYYDYSRTLVESGIYECKAPLYQQAFRWFREKYGLDILYRPHFGKSKKYICEPTNIRLEAKNTPEEAELACINKLIEIVKTNNMNGYQLGVKEEPKQETTLEEANWKVIGTKNDTFYNGAKWQAERMYSEEDMKSAFRGFTSGKSFKDWFEQFKKTK